MTKRTTIACAVVGAAALTTGGASALAGGGAPQAHAASTRLKISADPNGDLKFNTRRLTAHHGIVTITMTNPDTSGTDHGVAISGKGVKKSGHIVSPGASSKVRVRLKRGTYVFYCPVPGHRAAGMKGRLIVK